MKLSALAAQIKGCGHCEVINNGGRIFVGTGSAFYCMDGYPRTQDAGELGAMLGICESCMAFIPLCIMLAKAMGYDAIVGFAIGKQICRKVLNGLHPSIFAASK